MKEILTVSETKPKSVIIEGNLHGRFKMYCKGKSLKIGGVIENLIALYLNNPQKIQSMIEETEEINYEELHKDA